MRACVLCTGNPGSMNRIVSLSGSRWAQRRNVEKLPCIEPTVGIHPRGSTSISRKALRKRDDCFFRLGIPYMFGYSDATPASRAFFSASIPTRVGGSPGIPISRWRNSTEVVCSRARAIAPDWRIVALDISSISICFNTEANAESVIGSFIISGGGEKPFQIYKKNRIFSR